MTIAAILGEYRRLLRRRPPLVLGDSPNRRFQVRDLRMRSVAWPQLDRLASTTLPAGIAATVADLSAQLRVGRAGLAIAALSNVAPSARSGSDQWTVLYVG